MVVAALMLLAQAARAVQAVAETELLTVLLLVGTEPLTQAVAVAVVAETHQRAF